MFLLIFFLSFFLHKKKYSPNCLGSEIRRNFSHPDEVGKRYDGSGRGRASDKRQLERHQQYTRCTDGQETLRRSNKMYNFQLFLPPSHKTNIDSFFGSIAVCYFRVFFTCLSLCLFFPIASSRKRRKGNGSGSSSQEPQPKNAVAILNELKKNLVYELESQEGPYHAPVFTMSVMVSDLLMFFWPRLIKSLPWCSSLERRIEITKI